VQYFGSSNAIKREITTNILSTIQQEGRFVRFIDNQWIVISDEEARQKIAHAIQYRIRLDISQPLAGRDISDPPEPVSAAREIVTNETTATKPLELKVTKPLELKEETQLTDHFQESFRLPNQITVNQMYQYNCNLHFSSQGSPGEQESSPGEQESSPGAQEQEQAYRHETEHRESLLEQFDVPQPSKDFSSMYHQATLAIRRVSDDGVIENCTFSPFPPFTTQHPFNICTHDGQCAVSDNINYKPYENSHINGTQQQQQNCQQNNMLSHTIPNGCASPNHDQRPPLSLTFEAAFDPTPLQGHHSFSSFPDMDDKVSPTIFLASESIDTIDTFPDDSAESVKIGNEVLVYPDASSFCLTSFAHNPLYNARQGYEVTTTENIFQQLQQIGAIPTSHIFLSLQNHHPNGTEVGCYNKSALSLLATVSNNQQPIASTERVIPEAGLFHMLSTSMDDLASTPLSLPVEPIDVLTDPSVQTYFGNNTLV
jgi:hypothetical protein